MQDGLEIGKYRLTRLIGTGGMGEVYLAEDRELDRSVAIKFLTASLSKDDDYVRRFEHEAKAAAGLNHPNIVTVHEVSRYQDRPFLVMEHLAGDTLQDLLKKRRLSFDEIDSYLGQLSDGLACAHKAGITHRDIKPANILFDSEGRPKIVDFGLATRADYENIPGSDSITGTIHYMSPEQVQGTRIDQRSDLFSAGVVLYEMITGRCPFTGEYEAAIIYSIVNEQHRPLKELRKETPEHFESIVSRLLAKECDQRYQSAEEIKADLQTPSNGDFVKPVKSLPWPRWVAGATIIVLAITTFIWFNNTSDEISSDVTPKSLAVLPFENIGSPEDEYFADGITDALTMHLARLGDLSVISRTSAMQYKGSEKNLRQIGSDLRASYLLTGTVHWDKSDNVNRVKINASLINVADDSYMWAESYERVLTRLFALQSDIAGSVSEALHLVIAESDRHQLERVPTENLEAYDFYLRGNQYFNRSWEQSDIASAILMYQSAIALDSSFALAWAMLSRGYESIYWEYYDRSDSIKTLALLAAKRSLALQPDLIEGEMALGFYYYHCENDYEQAWNRFTRAGAMQPSIADLHAAQASIQRRQGNFKAAAINFIRASDLDPRSHLKTFDAALTLGMDRKYKQAEKYLQKTIDLAPNWGLAHTYRAWLHISRDGDREAARRVIDRAQSSADLNSSKYYWWLARIIENDYDHLLNEMSSSQYPIRYYLQCAQFHRLRGRYETEYKYADSARQLLEVIITERPDDARYNSYLGLAFAGLRQEEPAIRYGRRAMELLPTSRDAFDALFIMIDFAEILVIFEQYEAAIEQLEYLVSIPGFISIPYLKTDRLWFPLYKHPRFKQLLRSDNKNLTLP